ncbi:MAG: put [Myxococcaceae bacterium]|nr:put [Myxococcaceae bacterium]
MLIDPRPRNLDVICAGEAHLNAARPEQASASDRRVSLRPGGGAVRVAVSLAKQGLYVGLATVLADDSTGRAFRAKIAASGVDAAGVELAPPTQGLVLVRGGARQVVASREQEQPIAVPESWSARVLLLSGVSPTVSCNAALCKAARAARRVGTIVVVDLNASWALWQGRDSRAVHMLLREADVVSCTAQDLFALAMAVPTLRAALRATAVLVLSDGAGHTLASGPFGEVTHARPPATAVGPLREGDAFTAAICFELARSGHANEGGGALWARALRRSSTFRPG